MHSDPAAAGRQALADRARRISRIRRRIAATAVGAFALVWGLIAATGSMAKGLFADLRSERLADAPSVAVACAGDLRVGRAAGRPAFTGIVQATAVAPTALEAEVRAKAALLSGPAGAAGWLPDGGVLVFDDGQHAVLPAPDTLDAWGETTMAA